MIRTFLERSNDRPLPPDYAGDVLVWDIDKTYLDTNFSTWRGLLGIPFEFAVDKRTIPGSVPLLRALRHGPERGRTLVPLFFISGSPFQLRRVIERRMTLDGVQFDGITFKDQLGLLLARRGREIRAQVGYKLLALLHYRREIPKTARWLLFGDDAEEDATAFLLFGEVCAGLRDVGLEHRLERHGVSKPYIDAVLALVAGVEVTADPVDRIFIHLIRGSGPERFRHPRVIPTRSYLQTAMVLASMGKVSDEAIAIVGKDFRRRMVPEEQIRSDVDDAVYRLKIPRPLAELAASRGPG